MNEDGTDHEIRRETADEGPARPVPGMHDLHVHAPFITFMTSTRLHHPPHDLHSPRDTPDVAIADFARGSVECHLRDPPGRVLYRSERPPRRHLHQVSLEPPHPAVVRQDCGPALDGGSGCVNPLKGRAHVAPVDCSHRTRQGRLTPGPWPGVLRAVTHAAPHTRRGNTAAAAGR